MASSVTTTTTFSTAILLLLLLVSIIKAQQPLSLYKRCDNKAGNYTTNSTFISNLQNLLQALTSNATTTGFSNGQLGSIPHRVYGLVLCRGDVDNTTCRSCLSIGSQDVLDQCPSVKAAAIWYDYCFLRYSNTRFASYVHDNYQVYKWNNAKVTSEWPRFNQSLVSLLGQLRRYAAYNTSAPPPRMFATGLIRFNNRYPNITALVQCTRDLTPDQCNQCLTDIIRHLPKCCDHKIGGRIYAQSCNFRYEVYNFSKKASRISLQAIEDSSPGPAQSPSPPPLATTTPSTNSDNTADRKGSRKVGVGTILATVISSAVALLLLITFICFLKRRKKDIINYPMGHEIAATKSLLYDLLTIRNATDNFSEVNKLGEGGFGVVYRGKLEDGEEIAVKKLLPSSSQGIEELKNEVVLLAKLQHRNLVKLLGLCLEGEEKMLIYEYMQNKSLERFLFDHSKKGQLHWEKRYNIICGIARGLLYLHEESQVKIIHRDLKASNILLDLHMNPKISDFGLARLFGDDQTQAITTRVVGTFGYMPPEYAYRGQFSNKSDVFGFGVLVLEIVTGRKNNEFFSNENSMGLLGYVWEHWSNGTVLNIMDSSFARNYNQVEALRCIQIGLLCVQEAPSDRPTMSNVILMLNSHSVSIHAPTRPAFLHGLGSVVDRQNIINNIEQVAGGYLQSTNKSVIYTPNELSITELDAR